MYVRCPACDAEIPFHRSMVGHKTLCPECDKWFVCPDPPPRPRGFGHAAALGIAPRRLVVAGVIAAVLVAVALVASTVGYLLVRVPPLDGPPREATAVDFCRDWSGNEVDAQRRYYHQWVELDGLAAGVVNDDGSALYVADIYLKPTVRCLAAPDQLSGLHTHDHVKVLGYCTGKVRRSKTVGNLTTYQTDLTLVNCQVTRVPDPVPEARETEGWLAKAAKATATPKAASKGVAKRR